ncbi:TPA: hypothetical protein DIV55_01290 [Patescibacteria group bacterium]|uniref:Uncharacterized protein n=1 Tax=Candidatus Gottesmanbacteria bacterium GW2011_GWA1_43_11 TaxID=1618436 RepID=A0A0G1CK73_9BACT|nr:MAG: hypothetical protein UV59_C0004G0047 [Candidatus Gottesmanbacteria bacterium GW2011_GWA1_43_11]HCS78357.1 hypothetical protein [Patescibacteria group bacterium]
MRVHHDSYHETFHLLILFLLIFTGFATFMHTAGSPERQLSVGITTAVAYALWGIIHHANDLNWKIVVEYAALASFGILMLWILLVVIA